MPNSHAVPVLLDNEVSALKSRLAEATIALDRIEAAVVAIDKDAPAEVHALAATILRQVLSSADHVRSKNDGFNHDWEREAYAAYEASGRHTAGAYNSARGLIARTRSLCGQ
jgi:ATP/maltotriose-dependent transcriptional regulator MalT